MTEQTRQKLIEKQNSLMKERDMFERMQTNHSNDEEFYHYCQRNMDRLDEEADAIRYKLEMRCCE